VGAGSGFVCLAAANSSADVGGRGEGRAGCAGGKSQGGDRSLALGFSATPPVPRERTESICNWYVRPYRTIRVRPRNPSIREITRLAYTDFFFFIHT
jgi:hypothetical protein